MPSNDGKNQWLSWEEPEGGGIYTRDHLDPSFAYLGYKLQITELHELVNSIHLAWDFAFQHAQTEYIEYVGNYLIESGRISPDSSRSDVHYEFSKTSPSETRYILHVQILASVVSAYLRYLKTTLSFILPAHHSEYPKKFKVDLDESTLAVDLDDLVVRSIIGEIDALGYADYPTLRNRFYALGIYPSPANRDLSMVEKYIRRRNEILHFHPGTQFISTGYLRDTTKISERSMWAIIRAFSRVVNSVERRAMRRYRVWTGYRMLEHHAMQSGKWSEARLDKILMAREGAE